MSNKVLCGGHIRLFSQPTNARDGEISNSRALGAVAEMYAVERHALIGERYSFKSFSQSNFEASLQM
jgi:hypothetical protein